MKLKRFKSFTRKGTSDKIKNPWSSFVNIAKRETKETNKLIELVKKSLKGEKLTDGEIHYMKSQSGDLAKIIGIMAMGSVSMVIPITLNRVLNKWNIDIMPKSNSHLLDKKEDDLDESN